TLQPIFAFFGTYFFFGERFSVAGTVSLIIPIFGSVRISWGDFQISGLALVGDILALLGAVTVTGYFVIGQQLRRPESLIVYNLILQNQFLGYSPTIWLWFFALAVIPTFLGHTLFNWALKWVSTSTISMAIVFEPIGASILAYFILGEVVTASQWLGGTVV